MDRDAFLNLPTEELAQIVRTRGPKVMVFPINGTRRWFMLEHRETDKNFTSSQDDYLPVLIKQYIELFKLVFEHGVPTLLTPSFGPDLMQRGVEYVRMVVEGLVRLTTHSDFGDFFKDYDVRVHFYGDYHKYLSGPGYASLLGKFDNLVRRTASHSRCRLFFGLFAHDATETIAEYAVQHYLKHGHVPDRHILVEKYYGEYVDPVDVFIGFDKFSVFDMPLLALGNEDLYFTVAPSPYLTACQLRNILYDHLYTRRAQESDNWSAMRDFYRVNREATLGVGAERDGFWYPLPQVNLPQGFE